MCDVVYVIHNFKFLLVNPIPEFVVMFVQVNLETIRFTVVDCMHADMLVRVRVVNQRQTCEIAVGVAPVFYDALHESDRLVKRNVIANRDVYLPFHYRIVLSIPHNVNADCNSST